MSTSLKSLLESVFFVADKPVTLKQLKETLGLEDAEGIREAILVLMAESADRGLQLVEVGGGWQFRTHPDHAAVVQRFLARRPVQLSRAARETLAIVAYRQPITRAEIEQIRGVDCTGVLKLLLDRCLIKPAGHKEEPGRPLLYITTKEFLEFFHLRELRDLPTLREFTELDEEQRGRLEQAPTTTTPITAASSEEPAVVN